MTAMADISRESIILAGGGRALLLQIAHPAVGLGVAEHSDFDSNPLGRLHGTLSYVFAVAGGSDEDATAMRRAVNKAHVPVRGATYNAMDPQLQLWVAATLYQTAITVYEDVYGALDPDDAESIYREYAVLGTALQMPAELWPATRADFDTYWATQLAGLRVDDRVRDVQRRLLYPKSWKLKPVMPLARFATVAMLPPEVRELFGLTWNDRKQRRWDRLWGLVTWVYKQYPVGIRSAAQRYYLSRIHH